jgi:hypothetical protein
LSTRLRQHGTGEYGLLYVTVKGSAEHMMEPYAAPFAPDGVVLDSFSEFANLPKTRFVEYFARNPITYVDAVPKIIQNLVFSKGVVGGDPGFAKTTPTLELKAVLVQHGLYYPSSYWDDQYMRARDTSGTSWVLARLAVIRNALQNASVRRVFVQHLRREIALIYDRVDPLFTDTHILDGTDLMDPETVAYFRRELVTEMPPRYRREFKSFLRRNVHTYLRILGSYQTNFRAEGYTYVPAKGRELVVERTANAADAVQQLVEPYVALRILEDASSRTDILTRTLDWRHSPRADKLRSELAELRERYDGLKATPTAQTQLLALAEKTLRRRSWRIITTKFFKAVPTLAVQAFNALFGKADVAAFGGAIAQALPDSDQPKGMTRLSKLKARDVQAELRHHIKRLAQKD